MTGAPPRDATRGANPKSPGGRRRLRIPLLIVLGLVLLLVAAGWVGAQSLSNRIDGWFSSADDYPGPGSGRVVVEVGAGDTAADIAQTLEHADVVASSQAFIDVATADRRALGIQPGFYAMKEQMSAAGALDRLLDPSARVQNDVTIPEGLRLDQTIDALASGTGLPVSDFEAALKDPKKLGLPSYANGSAEGFLFPATYSFDPGLSAPSMLRQMVDRYKQAARDTGLVADGASLGYSPREALTVASLVQAEVAVRDFGKASRVIVNRLAAGIPLQFDSTVNYALHSDDLTLDTTQLGVDSPYNTYANTGLPPGPINSPGEDAMRAAVNPPKGDWLYFVAVAPGSDASRFTSDYDQFLQWKKEFYDAVP